MRQNKITILLFGLLCGCAYPSMVKWAETTSWDLDGNDKLNQYEFMTGYAESNYFLRWSKGHRTTDENFLTSIFKKLDKDHDASLSKEEFTCHIDYYYFVDCTHALGVWDDNSNGRLSLPEFKHNAHATGLIDLWDLSQDSMISEDELSKGMFALCDVDGDRIVSSLEFNIWKVNR